MPARATIAGMASCPGCGRRVDRLHPVPPDVITRELLAAFDGVDAPTDLELCGRCVTGLA